MINTIVFLAFLSYDIWVYIGVVFDLCWMLEAISSGTDCIRDFYVSGLEIFCDCFCV